MQCHKPLIFDGTTHKNDRRMVYYCYTNITSFLVIQNGKFEAGASVSLSTRLRRIFCALVLIPLWLRIRMLLGLEPNDNWPPEM